MTAVESAVPLPTIPTPSTLILDPKTVPAPRRHRIVRYDAPAWPVTFTSDAPTTGDFTWHWSTFPAPLREQLRMAAWTMLNHPVPDAHLRPDRLRRGRPMRSRLSEQRTFTTVVQWRGFANWFVQQGGTRLCDVTADTLSDYCNYLADRRIARATVVNRLNALSRLHAYAPLLPTQLRIAEPPWEANGLDDYLPAGPASGENTSEPISPAAMGPLLIWALRFVEDFAPDILAARSERHRIQRTVATPTGGPDAEARMLAYLEGLRDRGQPLPTFKGGQAKSSIATSVTYIAAITETPLDQAQNVLKRRTWRQYRDEHPGRCPLDVPITATVDGKAWIEAIDYHEADTLTRHLITAAFVVTTYLTGMRASEALALQTGCVEEQAEDQDTLDNGILRHTIRARHFKTAQDADGNYLSAGVLRDAPWVAVPQVVTAIRVAEKLSTAGLLFPGDKGGRDGRAMSYVGMNKRIEAFISWINTYTTTTDGEPAIPPDPHGAIGTSRFRRTLAWHIARRPGGLVALAVQYGHMRTLVSEGYAARQRGGIHELLDLESARAAAEHLADIHDRFQQGEGISGPAAQRLIHGARAAHQQYGGMVATQRQAKTLLSDPALAVFENPDAYLTCNYDPSRALCNPDNHIGSGIAAPSLDRCRSKCPNIARTDADARQLRQQAERLRAKAATPLTPLPLADRFTQRATQLDEIAATHDRTRLTATDQEAPYDQQRT